MSETVTFQRKIGEKLDIRPEEVKSVKLVNGAVTDLELEDGRTERVKGSYYKVMSKLGKPPVKPKRPRGTRGRLGKRR